MKDRLQQPAEGSLVYEDDHVYACLASFPITKGHTIVAWKHPVADIHLLERKDYEHLMSVVSTIRNALLATFHIEKVYLIYMDEAEHVHWHLVPRYDEKGFNVLHHSPKEIFDFSLVTDIRKHISI